MAKGTRAAAAFRGITLYRCCFLALKAIVAIHVSAFLLAYSRETDLFRRIGATAFHLPVRIRSLETTILTVRVTRSATTAIGCNKQFVRRLTFLISTVAIQVHAFLIARLGETCVQGRGGAAPASIPGAVAGQSSALSSMEADIMAKQGGGRPAQPTAAPTPEQPSP